MKPTTLIGIGIAVAGIVAAIVIYERRKPATATVAANPRPMPAPAGGSTKAEIISAAGGIAAALVNGLFSQGGGATPTATV